MTLLGKTEPRIWTPPLRELDRHSSLGFDIIDFATDFLMVGLYPWQEWLLIHAFEVIGDAEGDDWQFRYKIVIVLVARQNGKTHLSMIIAAYFLLVLMVATILGTSLNLTKAIEVLDAVNNILTEIDEARDEIDKRVRTNGKESLKMTYGGEYKVAAVTGSSRTKGGRGDSNDLVLLDELREHRTWDAWRATTRSVNARRNGMVWACTNAGGLDAVPLRQLRLNAHRRLGDPDGVVAALGSKLGQIPDGVEGLDATGWFEWSAPPDCDIWDRSAWQQANPSMGYGEIDERTIASDASAGDDAGFRMEDLCQFVEALTVRAFPGSSWERGQDDGSEIDQDARIVYGIDLSADRSTTSIAVCGARSDGRWHIELVARELGTDWALKWLSGVASPLAPIEVAWQGRGAPISALGKQIKAIPGVIAHEITGAALPEGFDRFWASIAASDPEQHQDATRIMHRPQPTLDLAASTVALKTKAGGNRIMDRDASVEDAAPLVACVMAYAAITTPEDPEPAPKVTPSAYQDGHGVITI